MDDLIVGLGVALSIGLLVGLERGWREREEPAGSRTAGIRTYGISGLLGGLFGALAMTFQAAYVFAAGFMAFALVFAWFQAHEAEHDYNFSVTSVVAALCVFALGALAVSGNYRAAAAAGAALAAILASREVLHEALKRLSWVELRSALVLAVMTMIVLPLLPNKPVDPWGGLNPWEIWFFTVLTATISYLGYIGVRLLGPTRGFLVSGLAGALVSSTAVTVAFARRAKSQGDSLPLAGAAALAAMVSVLRVMAIVLILQPRVFGIMGPAALAAAAVFGGCGLALLSRKMSNSEAETSRNPFELTPLLAFAVGFAVVSTASAALVSRIGSTSLLATAAISGTFDVDVAVLSALRLANGSISLPLIGEAILSALSANAIGRLVMGIAAGPRAYWQPVAGATALALVTGVATFLMVPGSSAERGM